MKVAGEARGGEETVKLVTELHPHVVLMDIAMPVINSIEAIRQIKANFSKMAVLILTAFRIAQEVMSNIRRHSNATFIEFTLDYSVDALTLIINDNGQGFDIPERTSDLALSGKLGIIGMRERARLVSAFVPI
jgi:signal transduction histidine kinase